MKRIPLPNNKFTIVDDEDFHRLMSIGSWSLRSGYASRSINYKKECGRRTTRAILMHRVIMNALDGFVVDHIDGDKLNNLKSNLRVCTFSENMRNGNIYKNNSSGFKGVSWDKRIKKWRAYIGFNKEIIHLGLFLSAENAAIAYNEAAKLHFGEFAKLNQL